MSKVVFSVLVLLLVIGDNIINSCLITNCPPGGKRNGKLGRSEHSIKPCIPCGPARTGQCFGPNICCGPFGCLVGTPDTIKCQREGFFHERDPCIAGNSSCRKNTGRCAADGICCSQDACYSDPSCSNEEKTRSTLSDRLTPVDLYNILSYQAELVNEK